ncbi:hypothetical protein [Nocardia fluminea]|uniref:hypothetical protein n=1 Tax=Nocardia fluminea TaxID=134984 RepID=UPI003656D8A4
MSGELQFEGCSIVTDNPSSRSHIELMNTFNPLVTDPAAEAKADYAKIAAGWENDMKIFAARIKRSSESAWSGTAATAARQAINDYATDALNFTPALQALSTRVGEAVDAVLTTKAKMPPYSEDPQTPWNPGDMFDGDPEKDAEEQAQKVVAEHYVKPIGTADSHIPVLPTPKDPVTASELPTDTGGGDNGTGGGGNGTGNPTTTPQSTTEEPTTEDPSTEDPQSTTPEEDTTEDEDSSTPESTTPQSTTPESTSPQSATPSPGQPSSGTPSGGSPVGSGGGGGGAAAAVGGGGAASPGKAVPGTPGGARAGAGATASAGTSAAGRNGMPGMGGMGAGARGGQGSEDDEHTTPDYLVYDRESELLEIQPPALPPGGVIGG